MYYSPSGRELFIGVTRDSVFGPVISVGSGGINIEILNDRAVALPPLNMAMAGDLLSQTKAYHLLAAHRQVPAANMSAIVQVLRRLSELVCEVPEVCELDINPLVADEAGVIALDARIRVNFRPPTFRRYSHMAIHPYPTQLVSRYQLADGTDITIRPIRPEDADIERSFVKNLSAEAKYYRFMHALVELTPTMLIRFTQIDYDREMAFIAVAKLNGSETELGVARYVMNADGVSCEFALVVDDQWQHKGIGSQLMTRLLEAARARGFNSINGEVLANNSKMLELMKALEFSISTDPNEPTIRLVQKNLGS